MPPTPIEVVQAAGQLAKYGGMVATFGWRHVTVRVNILLYKDYSLFQNRISMNLHWVLCIVIVEIKLIRGIKLIYFMHGYRIFPSKKTRSWSVMQTSTRKNS